jgi:hypothetical protein
VTSWKVLGQWRIRLIENGTVVEVVADLKKAAVRPAMVASRADVTAAGWLIIERLGVREVGVAVGDQIRWAVGGYPT